MPTTSTVAEPRKLIHRGLVWFLFLVLTLRIVSYFTLFTDSVALTRVVKILLRLILTGLVWWRFMAWRGRLGHLTFDYMSAVPLILYGAYLLLGFVSLFWSTDPIYSGTQWFMITESLIFTWGYWHLYLLYEKEFPASPKFDALLSWAVAVVLVWMLVGVWLDPDTYFRSTHGGEVSRIGGYLMNPNELGMLAGVGVAGVYTGWKNGRNIGWGIVAWILCAVVLYMSMSRSSMMAFAAMTGILAMTSGGFRVRLGMALAVMAMLPLVYKYMTMKGDAEELASGTGRLPFWQDLLTDGLPREPWLGFGFMRIDYHEKFDSLHSYAAGMSHNTFIQVIMNLGMVGMMLVLFQMLAQFLAAARTPIGSLRMMSWMMFLPLFINSMSEFGIFGESNYGISFYQFMILFVTARIAENQISKP